MFDATPVENMFIIEYMPDAPDMFVRVYLYLRMACLHPELCDSLGAMARSLHLEESRVEEALSYWEREGLLRCVAENPRRYELLPMRSSRAAEVRENIEYYNYRNYHAELQSLFGSEALERKQLEMAGEWVDALKLTQEAVIYLLKTAIGEKGGKKPEAVFRRANKRALEWADKGIRTLEDAQNEVARGSHVHELARTLLDRFGMKRAPSLDELACVRRWVEEWQLTDDDIFAACAQTVNASNPSLGYLDRILESRVSGRDERYTALKGVLTELGASAQPTPELLRRFDNWRAAGFDEEALKYLAGRCAANNYLSFDKLEKQLERFRALGVTSAQGIQCELEIRAGMLRPLLSAAGIRSLADIRLFEIACEWLKLGSREMIEAACARGKTLREINDLLTEWHRQGLSEAPQATSGSAGAGQSATAFNHHQRSYTDADFGKDFFYNPLDDFKPEEDGK